MLGTSLYKIIIPFTQILLKLNHQIYPTNLNLRVGTRLTLVGTLLMLALISMDEDLLPSRTRDHPLVSLILPALPSAPQRIIFLMVQLGGLIILGLLQLMIPEPHTIFLTVQLGGLIILGLLQLMIPEPLIITSPKKSHQESAEYRLKKTFQSQTISLTVQLEGLIILGLLRLMIPEPLSTSRYLILGESCPLTTSWYLLLECSLGSTRY